MQIFYVFHQDLPPKKQAIEMVETFLTTEFEGGRHKRRVDKMMC